MMQFVVATKSYKPFWWGYAHSAQRAARAALLHPLDGSVDPPDTALVFYAGDIDLNRFHSLRFALCETRCLGEFSTWKGEKRQP